MEWTQRINWADALAIFIILRSAYLGSQRGFFGELFCILGMFIAVILGLHNYGPLAHFMNSYLFIPSHTGAVISFFLITVLIYVAFVVIYNFLLNRKIVHLEALPSINRIGGSLIGFFKGLAIASVVFLTLLLVPIKYVSDSAKSKSLLGPVFAQTGVTVYNKTLDLFSGIKARDLSGHLLGAEPIRFDRMKIKRKDKLEQILE